MTPADKRARELTLNPRPKQKNAFRLFIIDKALDEGGRTESQRIQRCITAKNNILINRN